MAIAQESGKDIVFLRKLVRGAAGQSYGIHVARLAGLPTVVLSHANTLLDALNAADITRKTADLPTVAQVAAKIDPMAEVGRMLTSMLDEIEVEKMTPIEAMLALEKLKRLST